MNAAEEMTLHLEQLSIRYGTPETEAPVSGPDGSPPDKSKESSDFLKAPVPQCQGSRLFADTVATRKKQEWGLPQSIDLERERIVRDLHDGVCQQLTAATLLARSLERSLIRESSKHSALATELSRMIPAIMHELKITLRGSVSFEDVPSSQLVERLRRLVDETRRVSGISCRMECEASGESLDGEIARAVILISQEALNNAVKHSGATSIVVDLQCSRERICLRVTDNGVGCPHDAQSRGGMGIASMRRRAELLGANLLIESERGDGTTVRCLWDRGGNHGA